MNYFLLLVRLAMQNARRNPRRSLLTAATVLIGTALTTFTINRICIPRARKSSHLRHLRHT